MTERKQLGKIQSASFGLGGYQRACIGLHIGLGGDGWGVGAGEDAWDTSVKCSEHANWTELDRSNQYDKVVRYVSKLLGDAKVDYVSDLVGVPIEATFEGLTLKSFRILTEVI